jgi:hypothetical protein
MRKPAAQKADPANRAARMPIDLTRHPRVLLIPLRAETKRSPHAMSDDTL